MPSYRCYFLDEGDHISGTEIIDADALSIAVEKARAMLKDLPNHRSVEVWQGEHRLYAPAPASR
jgi:hypothetical protein